jgi:hypothetical protein
MKPVKTRQGVVFLILSLGILHFLAGCSSVPQHDVSIDAISDGPQKFSGVSYRLIARDPLLAREVSAYNLALSSVNAALGGKGMYAVSGTNYPDVLIELDFGETPTLVLPGTPRMHDLYLQLSARRFLADAPARNYRGEEIWNVRVTTKEPDPGVEHVLPLLAAVASDYAGTEHQSDVPVVIGENSPSVVSVTSAVSAARSVKTGP